MIAMWSSKLLEAVRFPALMQQTAALRPLLILGRGALPRALRRLPLISGGRALAAFAVFATLAGSAAWGAAPPAKPSSDDKFHLKPGAKGKLCLDCHADFQETLKQPFVHTPVKAGECSDCHNPHASAHGKLLEDDPDKICAGCHAGIVPEHASSSHPPAAAGNCTGCHDPHASKFKNNLKVGGNDLCFGCHKDLQTAIAANRFKHSPVDKGCLTCHSPHGSEKSVSLLKSDVPGLCVGCHNVTQPSFVARHKGYPVAKANCVSCHDPHGSSAPGILWANVHKPVANGMCSQCHNDPSSPQALAVKKTAPDLCRSCHGDMIGTLLAANRVHWPTLDKKACLNCHNPHASPQKGLLLAPMKELCGSCHKDAVEKQTRSVTKHPPVDEGACTTCHDPHAASTTHLLANGNTLELCGTCHDWQTHSTHPIGEKVVDKRNKNLTMDCLSCHYAHGSAYKHLSPYDTKTDLCVQCHEELKR